MNKSPVNKGPASKIDLFARHCERSEAQNCRIAVVLDVPKVRPQGERHGWRESLQGYRQEGHSLLEMIFVISITMMILFAGIPNIKKFMVKVDQTIAMDRLKNAIEFTKNEAFRQNKTLTLCPSLDQNSCHYGETWEVGFILFENPKKENQPAKDSILQVFSGAQYGMILFKASSEQLTILPDGTTTQFGYFVYCPKEKGIEPKGLILNWVARVYPAEENSEEWSKIKACCGTWFLPN